MTDSFLVAKSDSSRSSNTSDSDSAVMKVIFLDVDGVLHPVDEKRRPFQTQCMSVFKHIMEKSASSIVLSSNWCVTRAL